MKLTLTIESGNSSFEHAGGRTETGYLLRKTAQRIEDQTIAEGTEEKILDINGNTVGTFTFTPNEG